MVPVWYKVQRCLVIADYRPRNALIPKGTVIVVIPDSLGIVIPYCRVLVLEMRPDTRVPDSLGIVISSYYPGKKICALQHETCCNNVVSTVYESYHTPKRVVPGYLGIPHHDMIHTYPPVDWTNGDNLAKNSSSIKA
jgi:hypothetical protein